MNGGGRHDERQDNGTYIWGKCEINEKKKPKEMNENSYERREEVR